MSLALRQGSPAWLDARRSLVTASDIPVLLGVSPFKCEADLADEKRGLVEPESTLRMRIGLALEDLIAAEYEAKTGQKTRRWAGLAVHPKLEWAGASPDRKRKGALVELKHTASRSRFADGLPQDVEAQVAWQMGVTGYQHADVAVLTGDDLSVFEVDFDATLFDDLVAVASDFRRRLVEGGPFAHNDDSLRRAYPRDNGQMLPATPDVVELVEQFRAAKAAKSAAENAEKTIASALRAIVLDASGVDGLLTYRKNADSTRTNWPAVAAAYRTMLDLAVDHAEKGEPFAYETVREHAALIESIHSETVQGPRVLRLLKESRDE